MGIEHRASPAIERLRAGAEQLLGELADEDVSPAGSSVAALGVSLAAALLAKSVRRSSDAISSAPGLAAQADSLRRRALELAATNADAYRRAAEALPAGDSGSVSSRAASELERDLEIEEALNATRQALLALVAVASDVCVLGALVAEEGEPEVRGDACVAVNQAEAGARAAVHLIEINLLSADGDDLVAEARDLCAAATAAVERAMGVEP